jgi:alkylated DNA repair dioxygenase AlkB
MDFSENSAVSPLKQAQHPKIPGLTIIEDFITDVEHDRLINEINKGEWMNSLKRRVQHYGYKYDYVSKNADDYLGPLPKFSDVVTERIVENGLMKKPEQCIINEYEPGQGISPHIDSPSKFGDEVISVSLGSSIVMDFYGPNGEKIPVFLPKKSLFLIESDARFKWKHSIAGRKKDQLENGKILIRKKRISLTFRTMI